MDHYGLTEHEKNFNLHQYNHALFHNMMAFSDIVWEIDMRTGTVVVLEDKTSPMDGPTQFHYVDLIRDYIEQRVAPGDVEAFQAHMDFDRLKELKGDDMLEFRVWDREQGWELHQVVLTPSFDEDGVLESVYLCTRNVQPEIRRVQEEVKSRERFREALVAGSYFHCEFDVSGDGLIRGPGLARDGYPIVREIVGRDTPVPYEEFARRWLELYRPEFEAKSEEDNILSREHLLSAYERGERLLEIEVRQTPPEGSTAGDYMQGVMVLTENAGDGHIWCNVIWRSISLVRRGAVEHRLELQSSNEQLRRTISMEEQFRMATVSQSLMVYNINLTKNLIEEEFYEIVDGKNYPMIQMVGLEAPCNFDEFCRRWSEAKVPQDSRETFLKLYNRRYLLDAYERGERIVEIEFDTVIGRGIPVTLRNTALLMRDEASGDILATVNGKDVSAQRIEERRQRDALRGAYESAAAANAAKSDFLARMSHDIRTPMNAVIGMTAIARAHLNEPERVAECLDKITVAGKHLLGLINEVLDMSKIESGKVELQEEEFDLPRMVEELLTMVRPEVEDKGHRLTVEVRDIRHGKVIGDSQRIRQVLMNFMSNAVKYTPDGGHIRLTVTERDTDKPKVGCFEFVFEDNGIGMTPEFLEHLFEPFTRAEDGRVERVQGTGLGMSISKNIVQMMNGTIDVWSELDKGTRFTVTIFLKLQAEEASGAEAPEADGGALDEVAAFAQEDFGGRLVLLVEDNDLNAEIAAEILDMVGVRVERACNGREAVDAMEAAEDGRYGMVFMDIQMPVMNGFEATRAIRALPGSYPRTVPIVAISANAFAQDVMAAKDAGMNGHIPKPLDLDRLEGVLKKWLTR